MSKLLDIVITHWTEPWEVGRMAFQMLAVQRRIDWDNIGVTIIHDGSDKFPPVYFKEYPFTVKQVCLPHGGISAARNYAIDHSDAVWIKFCDFDDTFAGAFSLSCIVESLVTASNFNIVWFPLICDIYMKKPIVINCSPVFIHDKIFRVKFLRHHDIRFNENLTYSEDFAFVTQTKLVADEACIGKIEATFPIYVFCQRFGSVNNRDDLWLKNKYSHFEAHKYIADMIRKYDQPHEADLMVARTMAECYYVLVSTDRARVDLTDYEQKTWEFYDQNKQYFDNVCFDEFEKVIHDTNVQNNGSITREEFLKWIMAHEKKKE